MTTLQNAQDMTFTFDGSEIGAVVDWGYDPIRREATFRPLSGSHVARPLPADAGYLILNLRVKNEGADAGQDKLNASYDSGLTYTTIVTKPDGSTDTFSAFVVDFPPRGSKDQTTPITTARCVLRISGRITRG